MGACRRFVRCTAAAEAEEAAGARMWARGSQKTKAESWTIGDVLKFKASLPPQISLYPLSDCVPLHPATEPGQPQREVRNKKPFNKHFDAERNHEMIYAGRFFEINPDRAVTASVHTILVGAAAAAERIRALSARSQCRGTRTTRRRTFTPSSFAPTATL